MIKLLHHTYLQFCWRSFDGHRPPSSATGNGDGVIIDRKMCTFISKSTKNYNCSSHCTLAKERKKIEKKMHTNKNIKQKNHCIIVVAYE